MLWESSDTRRKHYFLDNIIRNIAWIRNCFNGTVPEHRYKHKFHFSFVRVKAGVNSAVKTTRTCSSTVRPSGVGGMPPTHG